jgi:FkbM family methyltransferase
MGKNTPLEDMDKTTSIGEWIWPLKDVKCWPWLQKEKDLPELISKYCTSLEVVVEAGGNAGFYVKSYANIFKTVYTFEPDNLNFQCLTANVKEKNVIKFQSCLGFKKELVNITTSKGNIGMYHVKIEESNSGIIPILRIDDLNLPICNLIHLDIDGFEFEALKGAEDTIKRTKPIIALEWMNHCFKFGTDQKDIEVWLNSLGYIGIAEIYHEKIFMHQK